MTTRIRFGSTGDGLTGTSFYKNQTGSNGRDQDNPYSVYAESAIFKAYHATRDTSDPAQCGTNSYSVVTSYAGLGGTFQRDPISPLDDLRLLRRLARKADNHVFNAGIFVGEGEKSLATIRNSVKSLASIYTAIRRYDVRALRKSLSLSRANAGEFLDALSSGWLAWNFGIKPILQDAHDAAETLAKLSCPETPNKTRIRAAIKQTAPLRDSHGAVNGRWEIGKQLIVTFEESDLTSLAYDLGVHKNQIFSLAWELVPLSFVVDSVVPIGNFLDARVTQSRFSQSKSVTTNWTKEIQQAAAVPRCWLVTTPGGYRCHKTWLDRTVGVGLEGLNTAPKPKFPATWFWAATDLSLLWQRFGTASPTWKKFDPSIFNRPAKRRAL